MKNFKPLLLVVGLLYCIVCLPVLAAPKQKASKTISTTAQPARTKWEYCFVVSNDVSGSSQAVGAYLPNGQTMYAPMGANGYKAIASVLNRLGAQGWEVVAYHDASSGNSSGDLTWTLKRRKG